MLLVRIEIIPLTYLHIIAGISIQYYLKILNGEMIVGHQMDIYNMQNNEACNLREPIYGPTREIISKS